MTKSLPLALLISAGLLSSTVTASAYINYGNTVVNGSTYDLSSGAYLIFANLYKANLTNANLTGAGLVFANLSDANLSGADLAFADLSYANLTNTNLTGAHLVFSDLTGANLTGATVSYSSWNEFSYRSGAILGSYHYNTSLINYANAPAPVPEPSTYGLIGIAALV
jgi:uncharacterized protein YjbI with pentapeptide repeats